LADTEALSPTPAITQVVLRPRASVRAKAALTLAADEDQVCGAGEATASASPGASEHVLILDRRARKLSKAGVGGGCRRSRIHHQETLLGAGRGNVRGSWPMGQRRGREFRAFWAGLAALFLLVLAVPGGAFASARVTPRDRAATHVLLAARYAYEQALVASAPAAKAAEEGLAGTLGGECPGVLAGAPQETLRPLFASPPRSRSPRQMGEANRESRQLRDLRGELSLALGLPLIDSDRQAALAYARAVESLRWSSNAVTVLEHTGAAGLEWELHSAPPQVCADMKVWVSSGYKALSPATKTLTREQEVVVIRLFQALSELLTSSHGRDPLAVDPLLVYEGPREKGLARKIDVLERDLKSAQGLGGVEAGLERTLGLSAQAGAQAESEEAHEGPPKGSVEVGHGTTAAGGSYTVWLEPKPGSSPLAPRCPLSMEVFETRAGGNNIEGSEIDGTGVNEVCLSRLHPRAPSVQCHDEELTIEAQTLPRARAVRLHLSDGQQISSRVALVPAKLGGPAGFYYQVVRGPSPIPVALIEVDAHGRVLRTVRLPRTARCARPSLKLLPGGTRTIARGSLPQGPSFSIVGERYILLGHMHFALRVKIAAEAGFGGLIGGASTIVVGGHLKPKSSTPFALKMETGCQPHEYAILYGILKAPTDTVLVRSSGSLQALRRVRIPASLQVHGVLAYIALPAMPSELLVRTPAGKTIFIEKLAGRARNVKETCEGEAEGPG
jgi:hypothetical protein